MRELERVILLRVVDGKWMEHLDAMDELREGIGLRATASTIHDEYKREAYEMFQGMVARIQEDTVHYMFKMQLSPKTPKRRSAFRNVTAGGDDEGRGNPIAEREENWTQ